MNKVLTVTSSSSALQKPTVAPSPTTPKKTESEKHKSKHKSQDRQAEKYKLRVIGKKDALSASNGLVSSFDDGASSMEVSNNYSAIWRDS
jgi:hypothetical protein